MTLSKEELQQGVNLLLEKLDDLIETHPELSDIHEAFEYFCMNKYSMSSESTRMKTEKKNEYGIDFYSYNGATYNIGQTKIPARDYLESHPEKIKTFGSDAVTDVLDAHNFLFLGKGEKGSEKIKHLRSLIQSDKHKPEFHVTFNLLVMGKLNDRGLSAFEELKKKLKSSSVAILLHQIDDIVDDFLVGGSKETAPVDIRLHIHKNEILKGNDYAYLLANAADVFIAFRTFGWRLFDLNLRYEVKNSAVNIEILKSLNHSRTRKAFHHYNNGLIISCPSYTISSDQSMVTVKGAQIVNGLQTTASVYKAVRDGAVSESDLDKECRVQVKIVRNSDPGFIAELVRATNNQNPMSPRNLKSNTREQKSLHTLFSTLKPKWFYQVKQGQVESLSSEGAKFFKAVTGSASMDFRPDPTKKKMRVIDNEHLAKAYLCFLGFSDFAGDRTTHYFTNSDVYDLSFKQRPNNKRWKTFAQVTDFHDLRMSDLESQQAEKSQYLLAYCIHEFVRNYIPSPSEYRAMALDEGVCEGKISKSSGSITSSQPVQDQYLSESISYQTFRLMANMKEVLCECFAWLLTKKYGELNGGICSAILGGFDVREFAERCELKEVCLSARAAKDLDDSDVFSRCMRFLQYCTSQFWEDKKKEFNSTSRIRTLLLKREMISALKKIINESDGLRNREQAWKKQGVTFLESLPYPNAEDV